MDTKETKTVVPPGKRRQKCQYWAKCYRKDQGHKKLYIHPGDPDENQAAAGQLYSMHGVRRGTGGLDPFPPSW